MAQARGAGRPCGGRARPAWQGTEHVALCFCPRLSVHRLHIFAYMGKIYTRYVFSTLLCRFCVEVERFSVVYRELSRRQVLSVKLPRPEVNPCQDHVKWLRFVFKLCQGVYKVILRPLIFGPCGFEFWKLENTIDLYEEVRF
jgi:hypothetical protein